MNTQNHQNYFVVKRTWSMSGESFESFYIHTPNEVEDGNPEKFEREHGVQIVSFCGTWKAAEKALEILEDKD